ncbi:delta-1-pyrroline-5-carboxylate dehydrogenase 12A1, mitochondrial [Cyclospora cayetanensis]|uniref:Delta-1-pyrroline-5-carboxylate dehydrogenase 12A1, mitochondrial n=1 Tax=Cyclospora cayetanensis TaxID=88456 RepID=A0A6P6RQR9_9EIME|nr:delta-1-pyrroline-5-carboxylate dehydrogenase 12A1, mitochondrial [Cyclospora cayetanensis]
MALTSLIRSQAAAALRHLRPPSSDGVAAAALHSVSTLASASKSPFRIATPVASKQLAADAAAASRLQRLPEGCLSGLGSSCLFSRLFHSGKNSSVSAFSNLDFDGAASGSRPHTLQNLVGGRWASARKTYDVINPLNGTVLAHAPHTQPDELEPFIASLSRCSKSGLHNPLKAVNRYLLYGEICQRAAALLHDQEVFSFFVSCIQMTMPKSKAQAEGEMRVLRAFFENFSGDNVRFCFRGSFVSGDHQGQQSQSYRWPFGPVAIIAPFNFPLEIPVMQMMGALFAGNKPLVKAEAGQGLPLEQFIRFLHYCGMPLEDMDLISARGPVVSQLLEKSPVRLVQFTGSCEVAQKLSHLMEGRVRIEDAGFNWKILCGDVRQEDVDYVAWQSDQDAYALSGQKCSAQSLLLIHRNWVSAGFLDRIKALASRRSVDDLTISPLLSHTNEEIQRHIDALLNLEGASLLFGGSSISGTAVPPAFGLYQPTAVRLPLQLLLKDPAARVLATTEIFGPLQVNVTSNRAVWLLPLLISRRSSVNAAIVGVSERLSSGEISAPCRLEADGRRCRMWTC